MLGRGKYQDVFVCKVRHPSRPKCCLLSRIKNTGALSGSLQDLVKLDRSQSGEEQPVSSSSQPIDCFKAAP